MEELINKLSEEEKKAIETVKQYKKCFIFTTVNEETGEKIDGYSNAIDKVLNLIEKQQEQLQEKDKIISLMAGEILVLDIKRARNTYDNARIWETEKGIIEYFTKKAREV